MRRVLTFGKSARLKRIAAIRTSIFSAGPVCIFDASDAVGSVPAELRVTFASYDGISSLIVVVLVSAVSSVVVFVSAVSEFVVLVLFEVVFVVVLFVVVFVFDAVVVFWVFDDELFEVVVFVFVFVGGVLVVFVVVL